MLSIKELTAMAASLDASQFERQLGPFVLVLRPPNREAQKRAMAMGAGRTTRLSGPPPIDPISLLLQLEHLLVATLPDIPVEGMLVGRLPDCDLVVDDDSVSKHHARITWNAQTQWADVEDLGSSNGTSHNGSPVRGGVTLYDGDVVAFGSVPFGFLKTRTLHARLSTGHFKR